MSDCDLGTSSFQSSYVEPLFRTVQKCRILCSPEFNRTLHRIRSRTSIACFGLKTRGIDLSRSFPHGIASLPLYQCTENIRENQVTYCPIMTYRIIFANPDNSVKFRNPPLPISIHLGNNGLSNEFSVEFSYNSHDVPPSRVNFSECPVTSCQRTSLLSLPRGLTSITQHNRNPSPRPSRYVHPSV
jgi:hypothetical protein